MSSFHTEIAFWLNAFDVLGIKLADVQTNAKINSARAEELIHYYAALNF